MKIPPRCVGGIDLLIMIYTAGAGFVCFEYLLEEKNDFEEETAYTAFVAVAGAFFTADFTI